MSEIPSPTEFNLATPEAQIELRGFKKYEILEVTAKDLTSAYEQIGKKLARYARRSLHEYQEEADYPQKLTSASESLNNLRKLAQTETFTTDGLNHLDRYLQTLDGFAAGTGLTPQEVALLQIEDTAGCQTLCVSNTKSGEIVAIHTEEDAQQYEQTENASLSKRWVRLNLPDQKVEYCAYGSLCGYGFASGIVERQDKAMFQAADILGPTERGPVWANAMAFMLMDTGNLKSANQLKDQVISTFADQGSVFNGGYVIHQIEVGIPPQTQSFEYGGDRFVTLPPKESPGRQIQLGVNYPQDSQLQNIDEYTLSEDDYDKEEMRMMQRRQRRLELIARLVGRNQETSPTWGEQPALKFIHKILQKGRGDVLEGWFTGFSNDLVAQNVSVYASPEGKLHLIIRKGFSKAKRKMRQNDIETEE